jgi:hypothetical protein
MKIGKVNFEDKHFLKSLKKYLVESRPYSGFSDQMSEPFLKKTVKTFIKEDLLECDYSSCFISSEGENLYYLFCKKDEDKKSLDIVFAFPNTNLIKGNVFLSRWPFCFCHLLLDQLKQSGFEKIHGTIQRKNRENEYERALNRFGRNMFDIELIDGDMFKSVTGTKESLLKAYSKLIKIYKNKL